MRSLLKLSSEWELTFSSGRRMQFRSAWMAGAMCAIQTKTGRRYSGEKKKILFLLSVKMLLLQLPVVPRSTDWTPTEKLTKHSYKGLPLYCTLFDLSADLACPCGQCVLLQDRDIHRPSGHSCALQPIHSTRRNYIFQLSAERWWKYIGGKRMCGETQSAQSRAHKHAIKVNFIEITFLKRNQRLLTFVLCFLWFSRFYEEFDPGCLFVICVKFHIFLEAQRCCINYAFNWAIYKYTKLKIS